MRFLRILSVGVTIGVVAACGPSLKTTLVPQWSVPLTMDEYETGQVADGGDAVVVAFEKDVRVVDGRTGAVIYEERPRGGLMAFAKRQMSLGGISLSDIQGGNRYGYAFVPQSDLVVLFDNTLANEEVRALTVRTGDEAWKSGDYLWSLERYGMAAEALLGAFTNMHVPGAPGGAVLALSKFVQDLLVPVPELNAFLLNTVGDLKLVDSATGREIWGVSEFNASGIGKVIHVPGSGDLVILARTQGIIESLAGAKRMMRINGSTGDVVWSTSYAGQPIPKWIDGDSIMDVRVLGDRILLSFIGTEAYDLNTGERVFDTLEGLRRGMASAMGGLAWQSAWSARPLLDDGIVLVHHPHNYKAVGYPDHSLRGFDLRTGEMVWESEAIETMGDIRDLSLRDGLLLARVTGADDESIRRGGALIEPGLADRGYVAWDRQTGSVVWSRRDLGKRVSNLLDTRAGYFASDSERILRLDPRTGEIAHSVDHDRGAVGRAGVLIEAGGNLVAVSVSGVAFYSLPDLTALGVIPTGNILSYAHRGDLLLLEVKGGAHAVNLATRQHLGSIADLMKPYSGNLIHGYHIPADGRSIYVLHPGSLTRYLAR
jgi:outer membrane protein assembly factor BamB